MMTETDPKQTPTEEQPEEAAVISKLAPVPPTQRPPVFQYVVKFVCGKSAGDVVARGRYFTAINVHNPTDETIIFRKKFAIAKPSETPGPVSEYVTATLGPDEALEIDCPDILRHAHCTASFLKGFVVIRSRVELDVVAVYTAEGKGKRVETLHMERVQPQLLRVRLMDCVDFEDPPLGTEYHVPDTFTDSGATIAVRPFQWGSGAWTSDGFAKVGNGGFASGSGQEMEVNNVNLSFIFGSSIPGLSLRFGHQGGNLNIDVNGSFLNFADFAALPPTLGGVSLTVVSSGAPGNVQGDLKLSGTINLFTIGGQELYIDDVCPENIP